MRDFHQNRYAALLGETVEPGDRWLDLGAGSRIHEGWIGPSQEAIVGRAGFVAGCDLVKQHLAQNPFLAARVVALGEQLPFDSGSLDVVSANMVLEHVKDPGSMFAEVYRILRPGGRFVFVTPNRTHPVVLGASAAIPAAFRKLLAHLIERRKPEDVFLTYYRCNSRSAVRRNAESSRLRVRHLEAFSSLPFARRPGPLLFLEAAVIRLARTERLALLRSNLLVCLERPL